MAADRSAQGIPNLEYRDAGSEATRPTSAGQEEGNANLDPSQPTIEHGSRYIGRDSLGSHYATHAPRLC